MFDALAPAQQKMLLNLLALTAGLHRTSLLSTPEQRRAERDGNRRWARWQRQAKSLDARQARINAQMTALYERRSKRTSARSTDTEKGRLRNLEAQLRQLERDRKRFDEDKA